jgi:hypothetical protein
LSFSRRKAMRTRLPFVILLVTVFLLAGALPAVAQETIGVIHNSTGFVTVAREGKVFPAPAGTKLVVGDILSTGSDGSLGVILRDNSTLSLGPDSSLVIETFLFSPAKGELGIVARLTKGTMAYLSGLIGKLAPESARFDTPVASIGIRGTYFAVKAGEPVPR